MEGIFDNYSVKRQIINSGYNLLTFLTISSLGGISLELCDLDIECTIRLTHILPCRPVIASQLLLVDEVIRAGHNMRKPT